MLQPPAVATPLLGADELAARISAVGRSISADHPDGITLIGVLKGASVFMADVARAVTVPCRIEFMAIAPFEGGATRTRVVKDLDGDVANTSVVVVTGIVDTGLTNDFLRRHLERADPASLRFATLVDKPVRRLLPMTPDYSVAEAPDSFVIGSGLDLRGRWRNLQGLWCLDPQDLDGL